MFDTCVEIKFNFNLIILPALDNIHSANEIKYYWWLGFVKKINCNLYISGNPTRVGYNGVVCEAPV